MLNQYPITTPAPQSTFFNHMPPATPVLADMLGATIQYINARPYQRMPLSAIGLVIGYKQHKGDLFLKIRNTTTCRERWINAETDFLAYVH